jgi:[ribosomal protein S18]-alanine N-acetyltransferase
MSGPHAVGPAHARALAAIHQAAFPPAEAWSEPSLLALLNLPGVLGFAEDAGGMVLARVAADEAEILTLAVAPAARRQGIGRRLLAAAMQAAAQRGATALHLEVAAANAAALALYQAAGFRPVGRRPRYYPGGGDALLLHRPLG